MKRIVLIQFIFLACMVTLAGQSPEERYAQAGELYGSGDYSGAASLYRKLWEEGYRSRDLLYNAGNAFFKSGDNASAILFYERAKLLAPADEDIDYNLQIARSRITDRIESVRFSCTADFYKYLGSGCPCDVPCGPGACAAVPHKGQGKGTASLVLARYRSAAVLFPDDFTGSSEQ